MSKVEDFRVNRRPRILAIQKKLLVQLIENYFIRKTGHSSNVNLETIDQNAWVRFAEILNKWGPRKTSGQWKISFYYMKNRIRKSVKMIRQSNASLKDNLSDLDYKLYSMSSSSSFAGFEGMTGDTEFNDEFDFAADEQVTDDTNLNGKYLNLNGDGVTQSDNTCDIVVRDFILSEYEQDKALDPGKVYTEDDSRRVLVVQTQEEMEAYMNTPVVVNDEVESHETIRPLPSTGTNTQYAEYAGEIVMLQDCPTGNPTEKCKENVRLPSSSNAKFRSIGNLLEKEDRSAKQSQLRDSNENVRRPSSFDVKNRSAKQSKQLKVVEKPAQNTLKTNKPLNAANTGVKIPEIQKERMVQLIQNSFVKAFGRFTGANGVHLKKQFWEDTAKELNTLGPPRTGEQWKTTFKNIKTSAKAKLADDHNNVSGLVTKPLTRLEEKVLSIYGINALDGDQHLGEAGFQYKKTVPVARRVCSTTVTSGAFEKLSSVNESTSSIFGIDQSELEFETDDAFEDNNDIESSGLSKEGYSCSSFTRPQHSAPDSDVLREIIREIWEEPDAAASKPPQQTTSRSTPSPVPRVTRGSVDGNSVQRPRNVSYPNHPSGPRMNTNDFGPRVARNGVNGVPARSGVNGVPRLHVRRRSASSEEIVPITNINQLFNDNDGEEDDFQSRNRPRRARMTMHNEDTAGPVARDRSTLRNRYTSYEMVQQSMDNQERFIEDNMRNHSEMMFATDRNHLEILGVINGTLRALANIGQQFVNKM